MSLKRFLQAKWILIAVVDNTSSISDWSVNLSPDEQSAIAELRRKLQSYDFEPPINGLLRADEQTLNEICYSNKVLAEWFAATFSESIVALTLNPRIKAYIANRVIQAKAIDLSKLLTNDKYFFDALATSPQTNQLQNKLAQLAGYENAHAVYLQRPQMSKHAKQLVERYYQKRQFKQTKGKLGLDILSTAANNLKELKKRLQTTHHQGLPEADALRIQQEKKSPQDLLTPRELRLFTKLMARPQIVQHGTLDYDAIQSSGNALTSVDKRKREKKNRHKIKSFTPQATGNTDTIFWAYKNSPNSVPPYLKNCTIIELDLGQRLAAHPHEAGSWWSSESFYPYLTNHTLAPVQLLNTRYTVRYRGGTNLQNWRRVCLYQLPNGEVREEAFPHGAEIAVGHNIFIFRYLRMIEQLRLMDSEYYNYLLNNVDNNQVIEAFVTALTRVRAFELNRVVHQTLNIAEVSITPPALSIGCDKLIEELESTNAINYDAYPPAIFNHGVVNGYGYPFEMYSHDKGVLKIIKCVLPLTHPLAVTILVRKGTHDMEEVINRGADINYVSDQNVSALLVAVASNNVNKIRFLFEKARELQRGGVCYPVNINTVTIVSGRELSPLLVATGKRNTDVMQLLLENGAGDSEILVREAAILAYVARWWKEFFILFPYDEKPYTFLKTEGVKDKLVIYLKELVANHKAANAYKIFLQPGVISFIAKSDSIKDVLKMTYDFLCASSALLTEKFLQVIERDNNLIYQFFLVCPQAELIRKLYATRDEVGIKIYSNLILKLRCITPFTRLSVLLPIIDDLPLLARQWLHLIDRDGFLSEEKPAEELLNLLKAAFVDSSRREGPRTPNLDILCIFAAPEFLALPKPLLKRIYQILLKQFINEALIRDLIARQSGSALGNMFVSLLVPECEPMVHLIMQACPEIFKLCELQAIAEAIVINEMPPSMVTAVVAYAAQQNTTATDLNTSIAKEKCKHIGINEQVSLNFDCLIDQHQSLLRQDGAYIIAATPHEVAMRLASYELRVNHTAQRLLKNTTLFCDANSEREKFAQAFLYGLTSVADINQAFVFAFYRLLGLTKKEARGAIDFLRTDLAKSLGLSLETLASQFTSAELQSQRLIEYLHKINLSIGAAKLLCHLKESSTSADINVAHALIREHHEVLSKNASRNNGKALYEILLKANLRKYIGENVYQVKDIASDTYKNSLIVNYGANEAINKQMAYREYFMRGDINRVHAHLLATDLCEDVDKYKALKSISDNRSARYYLFARKALDYSIPNAIEYTHHRNSGLNDAQAQFEIQPTLSNWYHTQTDSPLNRAFFIAVHATVVGAVMMLCCGYWQTLNRRWRQQDAQTSYVEKVKTHQKNLTSNNRAWAASRMMRQQSQMARSAIATRPARLTH